MYNVSKQKQKILYYLSFLIIYKTIYLILQLNIITIKQKILKKT